MSFVGNLVGIAVKHVLNAVSEQPVPGADAVLSLISDQIKEPAQVIQFLDKQKLKAIIEKQKGVSFSEEQYEQIKDYLLKELFSFISDKELGISAYSDEYSLQSALISEFKKTHGDMPEKDLNMAASILGSWAKELLRIKADERKKLLSSIAWEIKRLDEKIQETAELSQNVARRVEALENKKPETVIIKDRTREYEEKWSQNVFLNDFSERDENKGVNVQLWKIYEAPSYIWGNNKHENYDFNSLLNDKLRRPLMILGQPGIGKSSAISYFLSRKELFYHTVFVYKCADLCFDGWEKQCSLGDFVFGMIDKNRSKLNGALLVFDGLDEISLPLDRADFVNELASEWRNAPFSVIFTCRENYIQSLELLKQVDYAVLQPWNDKQIKSFVDRYAAATQKSIEQATIDKAIENKTVLGIPLILYIVLAMDIELKGVQSIVDVYEQLFRLEGGIYDRMYDSDHNILHDVNTKKVVRQMSREIALWMYRHNPDRAEIPKAEYSQLEYFAPELLYGNYFKVIPHHEGYSTESICFVHRTIYEYFVADQLCDSLIELGIFEPSENNRKGIMKELVDFCKEGTLSRTIQDFIYRILIGRMDTSKRKPDIMRTLMDWANDSLDKGLLYCTDSSWGNYRDTDGLCCYNLSLFLKIMNSVCYCGDIIELSEFFCYLTLYDRNDLQDWSCCRIEKVLVCTDMYGYDFSNASITMKATLCNFENCDFGCSTIHHSAFVKSSLKYSVFHKATIIDSQFIDSELAGKEFADTVLENVTFSHMRMNRCVFYSTVFRNVSLEYTSMDGCNFSEIEELSFGTIVKSSFNNACFSGKQAVKLGIPFFRDISFKNVFIDGVEYSKYEVMEKIFTNP